MKPLTAPVDKDVLKQELTRDKLIRYTRKGENELYEITSADSPNVMREIGRLRELTFRDAGGGTGEQLDIDHYDTDKENPYRQLIVWDPHDNEIIGGYRYIYGKGISVSDLATSELFEFSDLFVEKYLPRMIELGRSFIQPNYQGTKLTRKGLFALDNLWDGLGALIMKYSDCKYFFGKVTMYRKYNVEARNMLLNFANKYFSDPDGMVRPIVPIDFDKGNPKYAEMFDGLEYKDAYKRLSHEIKEKGEHIPPLFNSYMNLSPTMKSFGTAINSKFGDVEETAILVTIPDIFPEKLDRYTSPLAQWSQRLRYRWWKVSETIKKRRSPRGRRSPKPQEARPAPSEQSE